MSNPQGLRRAAEAMACARPPGVLCALAQVLATSLPPCSLATREPPAWLRRQSEVLSRSAPEAKACGKPPVLPSFPVLAASLSQKASACRSQTITPAVLCFVKGLSAGGKLHNHAPACLQSGEHLPGCNQRGASHSTKARSDDGRARAAGGAIDGSGRSTCAPQPAE